MIAGVNTYFAVEIQEIEREETDTDLNVLDLDVLAFSPTEFLERHQFPRGLVDGYGF